MSAVNTPLATEATPPVDIACRDERRVGRDRARHGRVRLKIRPFVGRANRISNFLTNVNRRRLRRRRDCQVAYALNDDRQDSPRYLPGWDRFAVLSPKRVSVVTVPGAAVGMTLIVIVAVVPVASEAIDRVRTPAL